MHAAPGGRLALADASRLWTATVWTAAALSLAAGWSHMAYMSSHWREWWAYGLFFLASGLGQAAYSAVLLRWPRPRVALAGIVANVAIIALYVDTRTIGIPMGPNVNTIEHPRAGDLLTTAAEFLLVVLLLTLVGPRARRALVNVLVVAAIVMWAARLSGQIA